MTAPKGNKNAVGNKGGGRLTFIGRSSRSRRRWHATLALWIENWLICSEFARQQSNTWTVEHVEFAATLKSGKETADERVERSLYHKAVNVMMSFGSFAPGMERSLSTRSSSISPRRTPLIFFG
jgi:hypothetical protein